VLVTPTVTVGVIVMTTVVAVPPAVRLNSLWTTKSCSGDWTTMAQLPSFMSAYVISHVETCSTWLRLAWMAEHVYPYPSGEMRIGTTSAWKQEPSNWEVKLNLASE